MGGGGRGHKENVARQYHKLLSMKVGVMATFYRTLMIKVRKGRKFYRHLGEGD